VISGSVIPAMKVGAIMMAIAISELPTLKRT